MRKEDLNALFTASLRNRKFKISCCEHKIILKTAELLMTDYLTHKLKRAIIRFYHCN